MQEENAFLKLLAAGVLEEKHRSNFTYLIESLSCHDYSALVKGSDPFMHASIKARDLRVAAGGPRRYIGSFGHNPDEPGVPGTIRIALRVTHCAGPGLEPGSTFDMEWRIPIGGLPSLHTPTVLRVIPIDAKKEHKFLGCSDCCNMCGRTGVPLKRCSKCQTVFYCSSECQRKQWSFHKPMCRTPGEAS